ncbi:MAG: hypothetical protein A2860_00305 [Candidatus Levybacteria bacterium RIFCSPHIGHO2_01_FULL_37_33]|nr:MAG: hypothetical protein A2860_00305 [Candidatus Levybacteria bacterium RIFCSPHIGHO2_01_FULL_37_33]OGH17123.1 MAG: hypothetical protein A3C97_00755 [Candidatus Levybacteria bacterium RIFCSPHIGHO2_02_FULL_37_11]OGH29839.1 MAG: hypothetical protein A3F30_00270 [Candidatus Levybacteria bacterium RIFCSPHIGHO2_12_FULL_37_12]OGH32893.1 MAG: hypothetical protein A2953_02000 [Candidatus Levybacteria bacterium RIFCSPLOWO2_01_FULL_36_54]
MNTKYMFIYFLVILVVIGVIYSLNQKKPTNPFDNSPISLPSGEPTPQPTTPPTQAPVSITKLLIEDTQVGTGTPAASGNTITVNYTGMFTDGKVFDSSEGRQPLTVEIGTGKVIAGWDQGIIGMRMGGKRRLIIPADLAYGQKGAGGVIPPNTTLIFDIELLDVK